MDLPKCRICGDKHRLGGCPSNATKSRGSRNEIADPDAPVARQSSRSESQKVQPSDHRAQAGVASRPRGTKPAKKAKPKKKGKTKKNLPATPTVKVGKPVAREAVIAAIENGAIEKAIRVGPPRKGEEHKTLTATKPWEKLGMSRPSWYRKGKPAPEDKR